MRRFSTRSAGLWSFVSRNASPLRRPRTARVSPAFAQCSVCPTRYTARAVVPQRTAHCSISLSAHTNACAMAAATRSSSSAAPSPSSSSSLSWSSMGTFAAANDDERAEPWPSNTHMRSSSDRPRNWHWMTTASSMSGRRPCMSTTPTERYIASI
eukprot:Amastigsp_a1459_27.p4 type:complete len:155 gc:universal Amastigsp_a1459_27:565-1029(+)